MKKKGLNILLLFLLLNPGLLYAAEGHDPVQTAIWQAIDLCIFIVILVIANFAVGNMAKKFWQGRWQTTEKSINDGTKVLSEAQEKLRIATENNKNLELTIQSVVSKIREKTQNECEQILKAANEKAADLNKQALNHAELEKKALERGIKGELVQDVIAKATQRLKLSNTIENDRQRRFATIKMLRDYYATKSLEN